MKAVRFVALALLLIFLASVGARAEEAFPQPVVGVLLVDERGNWDREGQERWRPQVPPGVITDWTQILSPAAVSRLSYQQRAQLLAIPERLAASSRRLALLQVDRLLLLGPARGRRIPGQLINLATGARRRLLSAPADPLSEGRRELILAALGEGPAPVPVQANVDSGLYHRPDAPHLSPRAPMVAFPDRDQAEAQHYRACAICFPEENRLFQYDDTDLELGRYVAGYIEHNYRVSQDSALLERVRRVGRRLVEANELDLGYRFLVLDSDEINAFSAPTGPVYITSGLLGVVESDDELAAILAHELAHSERRHVRQSLERAQGLNILSAILVIATRSPWARVGGDLLSGILSSGYSRGFELESDRDALVLTYAAGYHPEDFLLTLHKLQELSQRRPRGTPGWLRTHPGEDQRLAQAQELLTRLQPLGAVVEQVQARDPSLAEWLRRHPTLYLENPAEAEAFRQAWAGLVVAEAAPAAEGAGEPAGAEGALPAAPQGTPGQTAPGPAPAGEASRGGE